MWQEAAKEEAAAGTAAAQELETARQQVRGAGWSGGSEWDPDWHSKGFGTALESVVAGSSWFLHVVLTT